MPRPNNPQLYANVKKRVYGRIRKHSAYRSAQVVKEYKKEGGTYSGDRSKGKLTQWFKEEWKNQRGEEGYKKKGDYYRPTKKVSKDTPTTHKELTSDEKKKASQTKAEGKRIKQFKSQSSYRVKDRQRTKAKQMGYTIKSSKVKNKKLDVFDKDQQKAASIGALGYRDYASLLQKGDKELADRVRNAYIKRHAKEPKSKDGKPTPSRFSDIILWS